MKRFRMKVNGRTLNATSATRDHVERWFFDQEKQPQTCHALTAWATEMSSRFYENIVRYYGEADSVLVGWTTKGDLLLVATADNQCEAFCATVPAGLVPMPCDYCQMQAAMDRVNVRGVVGYA